MPKIDSQTSSTNDLDQGLLKALELKTQKFVIDSDCLKINEAGWKAFNTFGTDIFTTLKYDLGLNFTKCLISFDLYPLPESPDWPPTNPEDYDFVDPDYGMQILNFFGFDSNKDSIKVEFYEKLSEGHSDFLIDQGVKAFIAGQKTIAINYRKRKADLNDPKSNVAKFSPIYQNLAKKYDIKEIILVTTAIEAPSSFTLKGVIPAFTIVFYHDTRNAFKDSNLTQFKDITEQITQWLDFDNSQEIIKYLNQKMLEKKEKIIEAKKHLEKALTVPDADEQTIDEETLYARNKIFEVLYPAFFLPKPKQADLQFSDRVKIEVEEGKPERKLSALEFLEKYYGQYLAFFGAEQDTLFQDQLNQFDPKLKENARAHVNRMITKDQLYKGKPLPEFNQIIKPISVQNDLIVDQFSIIEKDFINHLSNLIKERKAPSKNRPSYKYK